jgi:hypothetical protein
METLYPVERDRPVTVNEVNELRLSAEWDLVDETFRQVLERSYSHYSVRARGRLVGFVNILSDGIGDAFLLNLLVHKQRRRDRPVVKKV